MAWACLSEYRTALPNKTVPFKSHYHPLYCVPSPKLLQTSGVVKFRWFLVPLCLGQVGLGGWAQKVSTNAWTFTSPFSKFIVRGRGVCRFVHRERLFSIFMRCVHRVVATSASIAPPLLPPLTHSTQGGLIDGFAIYLLIDLLIATGAASVPPLLWPSSE